MPERNLVPKAFHFSTSLDLILMMGIAILLVGQLGCSKLRNSALHDTLVPPSQQPMARAIADRQESDSRNEDLLDTESSSRAVRNYLGQKVTPEAPEARIIRSSQDQGRPEFKLTASTDFEDRPAPAPSIASASNSLEGMMGGDFEPSIDKSCEHTGQCECHKDPEPLKLAKVQPFDPNDFVTQDAKVVPIAPSIASAMQEAPGVQKASAVSEVSNRTSQPYRVAANVNNEAESNRVLAGQIKSAKTELLIDPTIRESGPVTTTPKSDNAKLAPVTAADATGNVIQLGAQQTEKEASLEVLTLKANPIAESAKVMKLAAIPREANSTRRPEKSTTPDQPVARSIPTGVSSTLPALGDIRVEEIKPGMGSVTKSDAEVTVTDIASSRSVAKKDDDWNLKVEPIHAPVHLANVEPVDAKLDAPSRALGPVNDFVEGTLNTPADEHATPVPMIVTPKIEIQTEVDELPIAIVIPCHCGGVDCQSCNSRSVGDKIAVDERLAVTGRSNELHVDRDSIGMRAANNFSPIDQCACGKAVCVCEPSNRQTQPHLMADTTSGENAFESNSEESNSVESFSIEPKESQPNNFEAEVVAEPSRVEPNDSSDLGANEFGTDEVNSDESPANKFDPSSASNDFAPVQPEASSKPIPPAMPPTEERANEFEVSPPEPSNHTLDRAESFSPLDSESNAKPAATTSESETQPANIGSTSERPARQRRPVVEGEVPEEKVMPAESAKKAYVPSYTPVDPYTAPTLREQLAVTIEKVRQSIDRETDQASRNGLEVNLQLLELLSQQASQIDANGRMINNDQKRSLHHQLKALSTMLTNGQTQAVANSADTLESLQQAVEELQALAELRVVNGRFCTEITGFGKFKSIASSNLASDQRVLMYCEVENQTSIAVNNGSGAQEYRTNLQGSMVIYDANGQVAQRKTFPSVTDVAMNRRRDFYMYFPFQLEYLAPGEYRLELILSDLNGSKSATLKPGIHFTVAR